MMAKERETSCKILISENSRSPSSWTILPQRFDSIFVDISWLDMIYAIAYVASTKQYKKVQNELENLLGGPERVLVTLSVRSAFDLLLQAMNFPPGSEMICTNISIKNIKDIAKHHKLVLKAVDFDLSDLKPRLRDIEEAVTQKTVAIMVVQLFGKKFKMDKIQLLAKKHNVLLIEDCAQGFIGPESFTDLDADITFFSFGSIKRQTCLGGALTFIKDPDLSLKMRKIHDLYDIQGRLTYFKKVIKYAFIISAINHPVITWILSKFIGLFYEDYKVLFKSFLRAFPGDLLKLIRFQPSLPLLLLLKRRMSQEVQMQVSHELGLLNAEFAAACLIDKPVFVVGCLSQIRDFWLFPVLVDSPKEVEKELQELNVSAFSKASSMVLINDDEDQASKLKSSHFLLKHVLFLPIDKRSPKHHLTHVCDSIETVFRNRESIFDIAKREGVLLRNDKEIFLSLTSNFF